MGGNSRIKSDLRSIASLWPQVNSNFVTSDQLHFCPYIIRWYSNYVIWLYYQTNTWNLIPNKPIKLEHESDDRADNTVTHVCVSMMVLPMGKIWHVRGKFDLSLYCGSVKPKFQTGLGDRFLWESCKLWFLNFTDNFGTVSSKVHMKALTIFVPMKHQCQWTRDVSIRHDVPSGK